MILCSGVMSCNGGMGGFWLSLATLPCPINDVEKEMQVRMADQAMYHQGNRSVFVGGR